MSALPSYCMVALCYFPFYGFIPRQRRNRAYLTGKALMPNYHMETVCKIFLI